MVERPRLEAVLFDAGGTLVRLDYEWIRGAVQALGGTADPAALRRAEVTGRRRYDAIRGAAAESRASDTDAWGDIHAYFGGLLASAGVPEARLAEGIAHLLARSRESGLWERPMEGAREAIDGCGALGVRRAAVSNSDGRAEQLLVRCGMREGLEFVVDSHLVGVEKPDPAILRIALARLGIAPEHALYVGDLRCMDEAVARAAGVHHVLLDPYGDYVPAGEPAVSDMEHLADWIAARFVTPRSAHPGNGTPESAPRAAREEGT